MLLLSRALLAAGSHERPRVGARFRPGALAQALAGSSARASHWRAGGEATGDAKAARRAAAEGGDANAAEGDAKAARNAAAGGGAAEGSSLAAGSCNSWVRPAPQEAVC